MKSKIEKLAEKADSLHSELLAMRDKSDNFALEQASHKLIEANCWLQVGDIENKNKDKYRLVYKP